MRVCFIGASHSLTEPEGVAGAVVFVIQLHSFCQQRFAARLCRPSWAGGRTYEFQKFAVRAVLKRCGHPQRWPASILNLSVKTPCKGSRFGIDESQLSDPCSSLRHDGRLCSLIDIAGSGQYKDFVYRVPLLDLGRSNSKLGRSEVFSFRVTGRNDCHGDWSRMLTPAPNRLKFQLRHAFKRPMIFRVAKDVGPQ